MPETSLNREILENLRERALVEWAAVMTRGIRTGNSTRTMIEMGAK